MGFKRSKPSIMLHGVINSLYLFNNNTGNLANCPANRQYLTFYLYHNQTIKNPLNNIKYGRIEIIKNIDNVNTILTGDINGGIIDSTNFTSFTITFNCLFNVIS